MASIENVSESVVSLDENSQEIPTLETFTLPVLQIIKEAQQQHGLRHGDYQRYRGYCSRRIRRIRKSLHFPQGSKYKVNPKKITEDHLKDVRFLLIPLMDAERCWSYSMQLKSEANTEVRKKFHMLQKIKKAVSHSDKLHTLCQSGRCDARTKLEAEAYNSWMKGNLQFEQQLWEPSIENYTKAKRIYEVLGSAVTDDVQTLYEQKVEDINPNIRYCAYNIGDESAIQDLMKMRLKSGAGEEMTSKLDELIAQTREKQAATLSEVSWRKRTVPVKNEHVRMFLLNVHESNSQIEAAQDVESKVSVYESLLKECVDALQILRDELKGDQMFKMLQRGQKPEGRVSNTVYLHTYLTYIRLTKTIDRNLLMIEGLKLNLGNAPDSGKKVSKPQDLVRLYDIIIQNLLDVSNLPGLEDDATFLSEIETEVSGFKAFRCFYIAQSYSVAKKWPEALALYERVEEYAQQGIVGYRKFLGVNAHKSKIHIKSLEDLVLSVDSFKYSCQASNILDYEDVAADKTVNKDSFKPLCDRLELYTEDQKVSSKTKLAQFPPDLEPIPCKPLYFDLALNHVDFPSLQDKLEQKQKRGGLTGFVSGFLGWGKK